MHFAGFVVLYLCFGGTWVQVVVENDLLRLICILQGLLCFGGTWVHVVVENDLLRLVYFYGDCGFLPGFWLYLGTCYDQKGFI